MLIILNNRKYPKHNDLDDCYYFAKLDKEYMKIDTLN